MTWLACLINTIACPPFAGQLLGDLTTASGLSPGVVYLSLVPTALAFSTWAYALSHTTAGSWVSPRSRCHRHHRARLAVAR